MIEFGLKIINPKKGNLVLAGVQKKDKNISFNTLQLLLGKKIIGSHGGNSNLISIYIRLINLLRKIILR